MARIRINFNKVVVKLATHYIDINNNVMILAAATSLLANIDILHNQLLTPTYKWLTINQLQLLVMRHADVSDEH